MPRCLEVGVAGARAVQRLRLRQCLRAVRARELGRGRGLRLRQRRRPPEVPGPRGGAARPGRHPRRARGAGEDVAAVGRHDARLQHLGVQRGQHVQGVVGATAPGLHLQRPPRHLCADDGCPGLDRPDRRTRRRGSSRLGRGRAAGGPRVALRLGAELRDGRRCGAPGACRPTPGCAGLGPELGAQRASARRARCSWGRMHERLDGPWLREPL
mmetsp:Transcript_104331/g.300049  ORF Transcript_104331/g.300049 Transcript_104331/m.300049 type:complete len:213 (+) Transcript_104331:846-1484(+)